MHWDALAPELIQKRVHEAVACNTRFDRDVVLGFPGSVLDERVFPPDPAMVAHAWLHVLHANPNHIGCHTTGHSERAFEGTQAIERDLLRLCAEQILEAEPGGWDGYVAAGGTESNIQAMWAHRNALRDEGYQKIGVLCSVDTHYSIHKGVDLLSLELYQVPVDRRRAMETGTIAAIVRRAMGEGVDAFIVILNMGTTMFGSIDDADTVLPVLEALGAPTRTHVDAAFGGFIFPFTSTNALNFGDPRLLSFTLDAHKMLQAPYGTGIHLIRKGLIEHTSTDSATYVRGLDCTLAGSRSGSNAVAVWMILRSYGSEGGAALCRSLLERTDRLVEGLQALGVRHFRQPGMNLVAMRLADLPGEVLLRYTLVPDRHDGSATWAKVVVMPHVTEAQIDALLQDLGSFVASRSRRAGEPTTTL